MASHQSKLCQIILTDSLTILLRFLIPLICKNTDEENFSNSFCSWRENKGNHFGGVILIIITLSELCFEFLQG